MGAVVFLFILIILVGLAIFAVYYVKAEDKKRAEEKEALGPVANKAIEDAEAEAEEGGEGGGITWSDYFLTGGMKTTLCKAGSDGVITCTLREGVPDGGINAKEAAGAGAMYGASVGAMGATATLGASIVVGAAIGAAIGWWVAAADDEVENVPFADQVTDEHKFRIDNAGKGHGGLYTIQNIESEKFCRYNTTTNQMTCDLNTKEEAVIDTNNAKYAVIYKGEFVPENEEVCTVDGICLPEDAADDVISDWDDENRPILGKDVHIYHYQLAVKKPGSTMEGVVAYCQENDGGKIPCDESIATQYTVFNLIHYDSDSEAADAFAT